MHHSLSPPQASLGAAEKEQDVLARLRRHTHSAHVRINHHPFVSGLTRQGYSPQRYKALLAAYYHLYAAIERHVEAMLGATATAFDYGQRKKLPWLAADLAWFGLDARHPPWRPSIEPELATPPRPGALIGTLYVIEGATLGGQVVSRHLRTSMNIDSDTGARFFTGYGDAEQTHRQWQQFAQFAGSIRGNEDELRHAERAALDLFHLFESQLDDYHARFSH